MKRVQVASGWIRRLLPRTILMPRANPWWLAGLLLFASQAQSSSPRYISLAECIQSALGHNLDIQVERYSPEIARYTLQGAYAPYDPTLQLSARKSSAFYPSDFDPPRTSIDDAFQLTTDAYASGVRGYLPFGLSYGLRSHADFLDAAVFLPREVGFTNEWSTAAVLTLRQPLLRDFWVDATRIRILVAKKDLKIAQEALRLRVMKTVTEVQVAYANLVFGREEVKARESALEVARQLASESHQRVLAGTLTPLDEKQAQATLATNEAELLAARQEFERLQEVLKLLITDDLEAWKDSVLDPSDDLSMPTKPYNREESWRRAVAQRPELEEARLTLEKRQGEARYRKNQSFPRLDVVGGYGSQSIDNSLGETLSQAGTIRHSIYNVGMIFSMPLSNTSARNRYKMAQAESEQSGLRFRRLQEQVLAEVERAGRLTQTTSDRLGAARQARERADLALSLESQRLTAGESTFFEVLQMQRNATRARSVEIRAQADHYQAWAQLAFSEGSTLQSNHLEFEIK